VALGVGSRVRAFLTSWHPLGRQVIGSLVPLVALFDHAVTNDIAEEPLVELSVQDAPAEGPALPMLAIYQDAEPPGPAGRYMIKRLKGHLQKLTAETHI
jgi:hypothetical protein